MKILVISPDFDFENIPPCYSSSVWELRHNHDLNGATITLPSNVILRFIGGKLSNGTLIGDNTRIENSVSQIFNNLTITILGHWKIENILPEWFGAIGDGVTDDTNAIQKSIDFAGLINGTIYFTNKEYLISVEQNRITSDYWGNTAIGLILKSNITLDLRNSKILIATNVFDKVKAIVLLRVENVKILNGIIIGDRYTHIGVNIGNGDLLNITECENILIENVTAKDSDGDGFGIYTFTKYIDDCTITTGSDTITFPTTVANTYRSSIMKVGDPIYDIIEFPDNTIITEIGTNHLIVSNNSLVSVTGISIEIYYARNQNIIINKCVVDNNRRNGITIESGRGIRVTNSVIINTNGISPEAGVDIEPYYTNTNLRDVYIENCFFENNVMGDLFGQNMENLNISNCDFNGLVLFRGAQNVNLRDCNLTSVSTKYSGVNISGNKFLNGGISVYNETYFTYRKPIDIIIINNAFNFDYNWDANSNSLFTCFNLDNEANIYNNFIFKGNFVNIDAPDVVMNRTLINTDSRSPELFKSYEVSDNSFNIIAKQVTTSKVLMNISTDQASVILNNNKIVLDIKSTMYFGTKLIFIESSNYANIKNNSIQIKSKAPDSIFYILNNTYGTAIFDIIQNDMVYLGSDVANNEIFNDTLNGTSTVRSLRNSKNGVDF